MESNMSYGPGHHTPRCTSEHSRTELNEIINSIADRVTALEAIKLKHANSITDLNQLVMRLRDAEFRTNNRRAGSDDSLQGESRTGAHLDNSKSSDATGSEGTRSGDLGHNAEGGGAASPSSEGDGVPIPSGILRTGSTEKDIYGPLQGKEKEQVDLKNGACTRCSEGSGCVSETFESRGDQPLLSELHLAALRLEYGKEFAREMLRSTRAELLSDLALEAIAGDAAKLARMLVLETLSEDEG